MSDLSWAERYEFAQAALLAEHCVANGAVYPIWLDESRFWYKRSGETGPEYCIVDAATGERRIAVTQAALALALAAELKTSIDPGQLIVRNLEFDLESDQLAFEAYGAAYCYSLADGVLRRAEKRSDMNWLASPDGSAALVLRDYNLWLRDLATGAERALTTDGVEFYAYGEPPAARRSGRAFTQDAVPEALWSPDGRWIFTLQTDDRQVPELAVADYALGEGVRPKIRANRTSLPGDAKVTEFRMLAIEVATGRQVEARYPRLNAVRMNSTPFAAGLAWWSADGRTAYFVDIERGERKAHVVAFDVASGAVRVAFSEESETYVEVSVIVYSAALITPLPETNELVWYSERTGRGHLYLYDLSTGALRNAITAGPWQIRDVLSVDPKRREIIFLAGGLSEDATPYLGKPCVASLDGGDVRILSAAPGEHRIWRPSEIGLTVRRLEGLDPSRISGVSPTGDYFVETVSTVDSAPISFLRRRDGAEIAVLETALADLPAGWSAPEPVRCTAADGATEIYGLLFKPLGYEEGRRYPVIDLIYGGPQVSHVPRGHFADGDLVSSLTYLDAIHLSALGAFVLVLDGRGTAQREQAFRTASYGAAHLASNLEDHVAALRQLAEHRPQMDLDRVGITGFSGGGYMTAHAALRFGEVFKVAVAGCGNYDQALFWHSWGERYHGAFDPAHYAAQAAKTYAAGLTGKLMFVHGLLDEGCHPAALFQLVQALIEADKDADLVILPRGGHDWTGYGLRRRWEYLATHLVEAPPKGAAFKPALDQILAIAAANAQAPEAS
ncbi:MAG TPA: DPP IV N-terminal domain-containing protein [Phenylobacterium sp.]|uniref:S9 family peptidase n=1 Tax=Phenylobacterium sp. TaxID=1871053 RepID=UPI002B49E5F2|nr:DPP IV N-terminal domain-containing protein [Phenylobacterium sp.]HKR87713.1 DPP IV N-terminal domain-containing protein [Phenylobacterium sp.]HKT52833.1 DPP IV N-terminal domain-containing protein [Caulobacteraceae bacterium]